ncbi:Regulator of G-protein signaling 7 [Amphibalanus amphitrite]|uniref:Regulator of G-protein signaling 7 n=1 Tax=Amphibalanus amphitrite TaxID=1232801 RepID=A0A6A4VEP7_AMPAM|nr:Regulator of G-protein signaling 7 [Amphibalanus amphitrite]
MVIMSAERLAARRKAEQNGPSPSASRRGPAPPAAPPAAATSHILHGRAEESPNHIVYSKMERIVERMQHERSGVSVRTVKSFLSKIPSVFAGADLIAWMIKNLDVEDQAEALHLAHLMAAHGYLFPIDDHILTVRNDGTFYRFQTPYFWPSKSWEPENTDYAVYLCKRTMQNKTRLELADYEAENLARLQKIFSRKWEFIFMQAEAQSKVDKKRDKLERKILDSQERAFWDVHRPVPGCVNTTEVDIKKACRMSRSAPGRPVPVQCGQLLSAAGTSAEEGSRPAETEIAELRAAADRIRASIDRCSLRVSKAAETFISFYEQYLEYDPALTVQEPSNPWISDNTELWDQEKSGKEIAPKRVKRWAFSLNELLRDPIGRDQFEKFLDKEYSGENLRFFLALQELKALPQQAVADRVHQIWAEFLAPDASMPVNIDSKSYEITKRNMEKPDRWTFEAAGVHLYHLMKSDSYSRYLRSEMYKEIMSGTKKKAGINLHFVNIRPETERAEFSNVVVEHGPDDTMTITADASACPLLTTRVTYEQDGRTRSATYATTVQKLRGRINVAALTHQAMAIGKFDGWPEVQLLLEPTSDSGRSSALEEQIRQEGAREVVTGCLRDAVVDLNFGQEADFPPFVRTEEPERVRSLSRDRPEANGGERMTRRLLVKVVKAAGLGASKGCKEPYCEIEMDEPPQKFQTETRLDTDHPFWDEAFVFDLSPNTSELLFEVFDKQKARDTNFLGLGIVGIEELLVNPSQRQIIPLLSRPYEQDPVSGSLTVEFLFVDEHGAPVEEGGLPHRVTHTSERLLHSGEILQTTRTTYTRPEDVDDGNFVKSMALKDMDLKARPNAKKSTLIIHSSKKQDNLDDSIQLSDPGSEGQDAARGGAQSASGDEGARGRRRSKKRSLFGTLRRRLGGSKSRSQSTEPGARQDWEDEPGRSASLDRGHYLTVPVPGGRPGGPDDSSLSDMSGISNASNRTYVNDQSSLVLETTENGVLKHYLVPNNLAKRGKLRKKGTKLHVFNEHVFVARHLPSALCSVCEKSLPRWLGKQAYECRNCQAKVHKQCHVRVETICPESTVHTMEL